jgi:hypothetical protein
LNDMMQTSSRISFLMYDMGAPVGLGERWLDSDLLW